MLLSTHALPDGRFALTSRPPKAQLVARVQALLPHLQEESPDFQTALLFLASRWTPNIDRLARLTRLPREFVALRARRWADHGLWAVCMDEDCALNSDRLAHAVEVGEGLVQLPPESLDEDAPTLSGWVGTDEWDANPVSPRDSDSSAVSAVQSCDLDSHRSRHGDADTLLSALWTSVGLGSAADAASRRAA